MFLGSELVFVLYKALNSLVSHCRVIGVRVSKWESIDSGKVFIPKRFSTVTTLWLAVLDLDMLVWVYVVAFGAIMGILAWNLLICSIGGMESGLGIGARSLIFTNILERASGMWESALFRASLDSSLLFVGGSCGWVIWIGITVIIISLGRKRSWHGDHFGRIGQKSSSGDVFRGDWPSFWEIGVRTKFIFSLWGRFSSGFFVWGGFDGRIFLWWPELRVLLSILGALWSSLALVLFGWWWSSWGCWFNRRVLLRRWFYFVCSSIRIAYCCRLIPSWFAGIWRLRNRWLLDSFSRSIILYLIIDNLPCWRTRLLLLSLVLTSFVHATDRESSLRLSNWLGRPLKRNFLVRGTIQNLSVYDSIRALWFWKCRNSDASLWRRLICGVYDWILVGIAVV